jgi:hypothetical protein
MLINGIILTTLDGIKENFGGFLDALEEAVIFRATSGGLLVGMVTKNLLTVSALDLFFSGLVAVFRETKDGVMVLSL